MAPCILHAEDTQGSTPNFIRIQSEANVFPRRGRRKKNSAINSVKQLALIYTMTII